MKIAPFDSLVWGSLRLTPIKQSTKNTVDCVTDSTVLYSLHLLQSTPSQ